jgi:BirA family biotin operon repressor/biotin-[acetyl-CoA-carboxylase] ligase
MVDVLPADLAGALRAAGPRLAGMVRLQYFEDVDSTNDIALGLVERGAPEGTAVLAGSQRAGRGRRGHAWHSPAGAGLYLSSIVRGPGLAATPLLTLAAGVAVAGAVHAMAGLPVELKWPNDVVIGSPWRKLAGVLCESTGGPAHADAVVVGIGINLLRAAYPAELADRATSIELELGRPVDRAPLVVECLARLMDVVARLRGGEAAAILQEWRRFGCHGLDGRAVRWQDQDGERRGVARDIDADGALLVETADNGRVRRIIAGEVQWDRTR